MRQLLTAFTITTLSTKGANGECIGSEQKNSDCGDYDNNCPECVRLPHCQWDGDYPPGCHPPPEQSRSSVSLSHSSQSSLGYTRSGRYFVWINKERVVPPEDIEHVGSSNFLTKSSKSRSAKEEGVNFELYQGMCQYATYNQETSEYICKYDNHFVPNGFESEWPPLQIRFTIFDQQPNGANPERPTVTLYEYKLEKHKYNPRKSKEYLKYREIKNINI